MSVAVKFPGVLHPERGHPGVIVDVAPALSVYGWTVMYSLLANDLAAKPFGWHFDRPTPCPILTAWAPLLPDSYANRWVLTVEESDVVDWALTHMLRDIFTRLLVTVSMRFGGECFDYSTDEISVFADSLRDPVLGADLLALTGFVAFSSARSAPLVATLMGVVADLYHGPLDLPEIPPWYEWVRSTDLLAEYMIGDSMNDPIMSTTRAREYHSAGFGPAEARSREYGSVTPPTVVELGTLAALRS